MKPINTFIVLVFLFVIVPAITKAQCTLVIDSTHITNVTCHGDGNGVVTIYASGAQGAVTYTNGSGGSVLLTQSFSAGNSVSNSVSGPTNVWWSPGTCTNSPAWVYTAAQGCPAGSAIFQGTDNSYEGCFLRSPNVNMDGINTVTVTMDISNSASEATDNLQFYCWVDNNYPTLPTTVNGVATEYLYFDSARTCAPVTVTLDLSSIPTDSRSDFLFYVQANCENSLSCSDYTADVDNVQISQGSSGQASNTFTGLGADSYTFTATDSAGCTASTTVTVSQPSALTLSTSSTATTTVGGNDGTATAYPSGGTPAYIYAWNTLPIQHGDTATGLTAATYTVTVTDANGCSATSMITVSGPNCTGLEVSSVTDTNVTCNGADNGIITATGTGGHPPYLYELNSGAYQSSPTFDNLEAGTYTVRIKDTAGCTATYSLTVTISQPNALSVTVHTTNVTVADGNNGTASAAASGGTAPYTYDWNTDDALDSLPAGTYCVTATDAHGCLASACGTVSQPGCSGLTISNVLVTDVSCNGSNNGLLVVTASGGTIPYQYKLNNGAYQASDTFNNLVPGAYTVSIKDSVGCTTTYGSSLSITQPAVLTVSVSTTAVSNLGASDGIAFATVSGGTTPYSSYFWSNGSTTDSISNLTAGNYCITVTDKNLCTATACGTVNTPGCNSFVIDSVVSVNVTCYGDTNGSISVYAGGGTLPISYSINNGATYQAESVFMNLPALSYSVQAKDSANCTAAYAANPVNITQPSALIPTVSLSGYTVSTSAYAGYQWYLDSAIINGAIEQSYTATQSGYYSVSVIDSEGCSGTSGSIEVTVSGIKGFTGETPAISIFPNPFPDVLNVKIESAPVATLYVEIYDLCGRKLLHQTESGNEFAISTSNLAAGTYLACFGINGETCFRKIIKQ